MDIKRLRYLLLGGLLFIVYSFLGFSSTSYAANMNSDIPAPPSSNIDITNVFDVPTLGSANNSAYINDNYKQSVTLTDDIKDQFGVMWSKETIDLLNDFEYESFVYLGVPSTSRGKLADGIALVFQNDPAATKAYGATGYGIGVYANQTVGVKNGFSIELDPFLNAYKGLLPGYSVEMGINKPDASDYNENYVGHVAGVITNDTGTEEGTQQHLNPIYGTDISPVANNRWSKLNVRWNSKTQTMYWMYDNYNEQSYKIDDLIRVFGGTKVRFGFTSSTGGNSENHLVSINKLPFPNASINKTVVLSDGTNVKEASYKVGNTVSFKIRNENNPDSTSLKKPKTTDVLPSNFDKPTNIKINYGSPNLGEGKDNANSNGEYYEWDDINHILTVYSKDLGSPDGQDILYDTRIISGIDGDKLINTATLTGDNLKNGLSSDATVTVQGEPKMEVTKTADLTTAKVGDTINYTIVGKNTGNATLNDVVFTDKLPDGMSEPTDVTLLGAVGSVYELPKGASNANQFGEYYEWDANTSTLSVIVSRKGDSIGIESTGSTQNKQRTITYSSKVLSGTDGEKKTNTVTFSGSNAPNNPTADASIIIRGEPKLEVTKTADLTTAKVGDSVNYTIVGENTGNATLNDVVFTDKLPDGMSEPTDVTLLGAVGSVYELPKGASNANQFGEYYEWDADARTMTIIVSRKGNVTGIESTGSTQNKQRIITYSSKVLSGNDGEKKTNTVTFSGSNAPNNPTADASITIEVPDRKLTFYVKQEVVNKNNQVVVPKTGSMSLNNISLDNSTNKNVNYSLSIPSYEADTNQLFKIIHLRWNELYQGYLPEISIPEFYAYTGYQLTSVEQSHLSSNRINQSIPIIDYSNKDAYWLTVYIEPKVPEDGPPFYNWDYKINDFGNIKVN